MKGNKGKGMLQNLHNTRDSVQEAIADVEAKIQELREALSELTDFEDSVNSLIDAMENADGLSVSVDVDSTSFDLSVDL